MAVSSGSTQAKANVKADQEELRSIFNKYASIEDKGERFMSYEDFINRYLALDVSNSRTLQLLGSCVDKAKEGIITFNEFHATELLFRSADAFYKLAFNLFDTKGNGVITFDQFKEVVCNTLANHFAPFDFDGEFVQRYFGEEKSRQITYLEFSEMAKYLRDELNMQMFNHFDRKNAGVITAHEFTELMLKTRAEYLSPYVKRHLAQIAGSLTANQVSFAHFSAFINLLSNLNVVEKILTIAVEQTGKQNITKEEYLQTAELYSQITPLEVDILFHLCELNNLTGCICLSDIDKLVPDSYKVGINTDIVRNIDTQQVTTSSQSQNTVEVRSGRGFFVQLAESVYRFALGAIAGAIGATAVYPIDLVKTRLQNQRGKIVGEVLYRNSVDCFFKVLRTEGFFGLYRGLLPQLVGVAPEKAIKLTVNDLLRDKLRSKAGELPLYREIISGGTAGGCQVIFTNPLEIVKIRLQVAGEIPGHRLGAVQVIRDLGFLGLYKGASACLLRDIPFSAIYFPAYAHLKSLFADKDGKNGPTSLLVAATIAGAPSASLTTPADVIKTRLQVQARQGQTTYNGIVDCARKLLAQEGFTAFWKGAPARVFRSSPQFGVTLMTYELLQRYFYVDFGGRAPAGSPMAFSQEASPLPSQPGHYSRNPDHIGGMKLAVSSFVGIETKFGLAMPKFKIPSS